MSAKWEKFAKYELDGLAWAIEAARQTPASPMTIDVLVLLAAEINAELRRRRKAGRQ